MARQQRQQLDRSHQDRLSTPAELDLAFFVIEHPTNQDVREYLRHSNANYAYDATRKKDLGAVSFTLLLDLTFVLLSTLCYPMLRILPYSVGTILVCAVVWFLARSAGFFTDYSERRLDAKQRRASREMQAYWNTVRRTK